MNLYNLHRSAPGICFDVPYKKSPDSKEIIFRGVYVGEFKNHYRFITGSEVIHIEKQTPMSFFGAEIPKNYLEIMRLEMSWYFKPLIPLKTTVELSIEAFRCSYMWDAMVNNGKPTSSKELYLAAKELY